MAPELRARWRDSSYVFAGDSVVMVGRDPEADVRVDNPAVSRRHAALRVEGGRWVIEDAGSKLGVFVNGARVDRHVITSQVEVSLGAPPRGEVLTLHVQGARVSGGPGVRIRLGDQNFEFDGSQIVVVGRDDDADVRSSNPLVSRHHARLSAVGDRWLVEDTGSRRGIFHEGKKVTRLEIRRPTTLYLGGEAGERMVVAPDIDPGTLAEEDRRAIRMRALRRGAGALSAAAVAIVIAVAVVRFTSSGSEAGQIPDAVLDRVKAATVYITVKTTDTEGRERSFAGSGSIISSDGLILTNAHVAAPMAPGQGVLYGPVAENDPEFVTIALVKADDRPAEPAYRAKAVVADGYLDMAVLRITANADGRPLSGRLRLPTVPIGDSKKLRLGSRVTVLGFPKIAATESINVTSGVAGSFIDDARMREPRAFLNTDARISPGNSGGLAADNKGRIIGVPTQTHADPQGPPIVSGRIRPIHLALPLIEMAKRGETDYVSPHVVLGSGQEKMSGGVWTANRVLGCTTSGVPKYAAGTREMNAAYQLTGMTKGLDLQIRLFRETTDGPEIVDGEDIRWGREQPDGCLAFSARAETPFANGSYVLGVFGGPVMRQLGSIRVTVGP